MATEDATMPAPADATQAAPQGDLSDVAVADLAASLETTELEAAEKPADAPAEEKSADEAPAEDEKKDGEEKPADTAAKPVDEVVKLRRLGAKLARRQERLEQREAALTVVSQKATALDKLGEMVRAGDKLAAVRALGIHEDEIVDLVLLRKGGEPGDRETAEERVAKLEKQLAEDKKAAEARQLQEQQAQQYARFREDVIGRVKAAGDELEIVNAEGLYDDVIAAMGAYHAKHGVLPDPVTTARYVEREQEELVRKRTALKKFQATGAPKNAAPADRHSAKKPAPSPSLTDRISDSAVGKDDLPDDPDERWAAAMKRLDL